MFTSEKWCASRWSREVKGRRVTETVLMPTFWNNIVYTLKATGPLVKVLHLVDSEKRPVMGYIYEAMDRCKEAIMNAFNHNESKYKDIFDIIDRRWSC
jgi:mevalonate kinase